MQAKDISDEVMFCALGKAALIRAQRWGWPKSGIPWAGRKDVEAAFPEIPRKVVLAKLASMIRRGLIGGCACGCAGNFYSLEAEYTYECKHYGETLEERDDRLSREAKEILSRSQWRDKQ